MFKKILVLSALCFSCVAFATVNQTFMVNADNDSADNGIGGVTFSVSVASDPSDCSKEKAWMGHLVILPGTEQLTFQVDNDFLKSSLPLCLAFEPPALDWVILNTPVRVNNGDTVGVTYDPSWDDIFFTLNGQELPGARFKAHKAAVSHDSSSKSTKP